jgi:hypothetical protein
LAEPLERLGPAVPVQVNAFHGRKWFLREGDLGGSTEMWNRSPSGGFIVKRYRPPARGSITIMIRRLLDSVAR